MNLQEQKKHWDGFGEQDPLWAILSDSDLRGNKWNSEEFFSTGEEEIRGLMERIAGLDFPLGRVKALDFGCGVGRLVQPLTSYFHEVHGVDIAPSMLALARKYNRHGDRCQFHVRSSPSVSLYAPAGIKTTTEYTEYTEYTEFETPTG